MASALKRREGERANTIISLDPFIHPSGVNGKLWNVFPKNNGIHQILNKHEERQVILREGASSSASMKLDEGYVLY